MASDAKAGRRLTVTEIFGTAQKSAKDEVRRSALALGISGLAGGFTMGLTALSVAAVRSIIGDGPSQQLIALLFYPIGFIAVIIGRAQLFTENTLYPVILVLDERRHLLDMLRLWAVVFAANVAGALVFALLAARTSALRPETVNQLVALGVEAVSHPAANVFWSGVIGGWLVALVAWVVSASQWTIGQLAMIWLLTFVLGAGRVAHCIAGSCEVLSAVLRGAAPASHYLAWLAAATTGNIIGGVVIVSVLNWAQVKEDQQSHGVA